MRASFFATRITAAVLALGLLCPTAASATVNYSFQGAGVGSSFTVGSFLTGTGFIFPSSLDSCTPLAGDSCEAVQYLSNYGGSDILELFSQSGCCTHITTRFDFAAGDFLAAGTYSTVDTSFNVGTLTVSVPEPATWAMMLLGFGAVGFAMRRGRKSLPALPVV